AGDAKTSGRPSDAQRAVLGTAAPASLSRARSLELAANFREGRGGDGGGCFWSRLWSRKYPAKLPDRRRREPTQGQSTSREAPCLPRWLLLGARKTRSHALPQNPPCSKKPSRAVGGL